MVLGKLVHELKYYEQEKAEKFFVIVAGYDESGGATRDEDKDIWSLVGPFTPGWWVPLDETDESSEKAEGVMNLDGIQLELKKHRSKHKNVHLVLFLRKAGDKSYPRNTEDEDSSDNVENTDSHGKDEDKDIWSVTRPQLVEPALIKAFGIKIKAAA